MLHPAPADQGNPAASLPKANWQYHMPGIGNLLATHQMLTNPHFRQQQFARHGDAVEVCFVEKRVALVRGPANLSILLHKQAPVTTEGSLMFALQHLLGSRSLLVLEGADHGRLRTILKPAFTTSALQRLVPQITAAVTAALAGDADGAVIDFAARARKISFTVVACVLGIPADSLEVFYTTWIDFHRGIFSFPFRLPVIQTTFARAMAARHTILRLIEEVCQRPDLPPESVLSVLVQAWRNGDISKVELEENVLLIGFAGYTTSADVLSALVYEYSTHPIFQQQLRDELAAAGPSTSDAPLPILTHGIRETLRLYPPVPFLLKIAHTAIDLPPYQIPGGMTMLLCVRETQRDERIYGPDAAQFRPERWATLTPPLYGYLPFGGGLHHCLGEQLAHLILRTAMCQLVRGYRFIPLGHKDFKSDAVTGTQLALQVWKRSKTGSTSGVNTNMGETPAT
jgi:cytochrome P450 monooxygenase